MDETLKHENIPERRKCACNAACRNHEKQHSPKRSFREESKLAVSAVSLCAGFAITYFGAQIPLFPLTDPSWIAVFLCAIPIYKEAWEALHKKGKITSSLLVSIAMSAAFALQILALCSGDEAPGHSESYIFVVGEISFLMALGEWLEDITVKKSRAGIERLVSLAPRKARLKTTEGISEIEVSKVKIGDLLLVRPNDMIPIDGVIVSGNTSVDQSNMTGESLPVDKSVGDEVLGGTWNKSGAVEIRAAKTSSDSAIAKLINLVEEAEGKRAPISKIADKWASYVVPSAIVLSIIVFFISLFILDTTTVEAVIRSVTILVVFCPCAFVLATPTAIAAGLGNAAKKGVLIKSGEALESLSKVDCVFFDKTGTLTKGIINVSGIYPLKNDEDYLLNLAASAEKFSEHPIAKAITAKAEERGLKCANPKNTNSLVGIGIKAEVSGKEILVSQWKSLPNGIKGREKLESIRNRCAAAGETFVLVCENGNLIGGISLRDTIREDAKKTVSRLKKLGYKTAMLTGDSRETADTVASEVGVEKAYAGLMPTDKSAAIRNAQKSGECVCMVGDGVNDAPALATADCSIAVAALGSDVAIDTAQVSLLGSDIYKICGILKFSKSVLNTIRTNISLSIAINLAAVALSVYGILNPVSGALVHNMSSVIVVLNSARLLGRNSDFK